MRNPGEQQQCAVCNKDLDKSYWTYTESMFVQVHDVCSNKCVIDYCKQLQNGYSQRR